MKDMKHFAPLFCSLAILAVIFAGWKEEEDINMNPPYLKVEQNTLNFEEAGGEALVDIKANKIFTYKVDTGDEDWCSISMKAGQLYVSVSPSDEKNVRETTISITLDNIVEEINVRQIGWGKAILLSSTQTNMPAIGGEFSVEVTTNIDYDYDISYDGEGEETGWIERKVSKSSRAYEVVTKSLSFVAKANDKSTRKAFITFFDKEEDSDFEKVIFEVEQDGLDNYKPGVIGDVAEDIEVKPSRAEASSTQPGMGIERTLDGNDKTLWAKNWNEYLPVDLVYYFDEPTNIDYLVYNPRGTAGGVNGAFGKLQISYLSNANEKEAAEWSAPMDYDFGESLQLTRVNFEQSLIGVTAVKLHVTSGKSGEAACAEMNFYKKDPNAFDWTTLFTDQTCSELKPGVTEEEILNCSHSMYKNIAYFMYKDKYPKEFRIAEFNAYPDPDEDRARNRNAFPYSLKDNPTGIVVEEGEDLVVFADLKGEKDLSILVQDLDVPGGNGFVGKRYYQSLNDGVNKIKMERSGLVYVIYHKTNPETHPAIKLHFATGKVNGYYDRLKHGDRWKELLAAAEYKYFDVLGEFTHCIFETASFRTYTADLKELTETYDLIVRSEHELMGLYKYPAYKFRNRMNLQVIYDGYMFAGDYHTMFSVGTMTDLCDVKKLTTTGCWGPAHEIGHCNQTKPGLLWRALTEVTNNIMSEYIQTTIFNQPSRLQTEKLGAATITDNVVFPNRYTKAWRGIMVESHQHADADVFMKLVPFWQLQLYFGNVLGLTPDQKEDKGGFYPDVFQYIRTNGIPETPPAGANVAQWHANRQAEFAVIASKKSGYDLTDFFTKWGFLTSGKLVLKNYDNLDFELTEEVANDKKNEIKNLNLPEPGVALEYITDNNWKYFKNKGQVEKGESARKNNILTMKNWKNVVVFEVRVGGKDGELLYVSEGKFTEDENAVLTLPAWKDTYKVYAVQYDNERIEVTF